MSSKSTQHPQTKNEYSPKFVVMAVIIGIIFLTIIIKYPRIFSPSNIGPNTGPNIPAAQPVPAPH